MDLKVSLLFRGGGASWGPEGVPRQKPFWQKISPTSENDTGKKLVWEQKLETMILAKSLEEPKTLFLFITAKRWDKISLYNCCLYFKNLKFGFSQWKHSKYSWKKLKQSSPFFAKDIAVSILVDSNIYCSHHPPSAILKEVVDCCLVFTMAKKAKADYKMAIPFGNGFSSFAKKNNCFPNV